MAVDLHVHTNASDGVEKPEEVVAQAWQRGLEAIAITDHDTLDGITPAMEAAWSIGIEVIPGVEISTEYEGMDTHLLGYFIQLDNEKLLSELAFFRKARFERIVKMVNKLRETGIPIALEQVLAVSGEASIGRPHVAQVLVELGIVNSEAEAFERYIGKGAVAYVPRFKFDPKFSVKLIRLSGGVPVLAHPGVGDSWKMIPALLEEGLQGMEVYYPEHNQEMIDYFLKLCQQHSLLATGGSDYHGRGDEKRCVLGASAVSYKVVEELKELALSIR